jgi:hypothetical protein
MMMMRRRFRASTSQRSTCRLTLRRLGVHPRRRLARRHRRPAHRLAHRRRPAHRLRRLRRRRHRRRPALLVHLRRRAHRAALRTRTVIMFNLLTKIIKTVFCESIAQKKLHTFLSIFALIREATQFADPNSSRNAKFTLSFKPIKNKNLLHFNIPQLDILSCQVDLVKRRDVNDRLQRD